jgi:hypothetical protein
MVPLPQEQRVASGCQLWTMNCAITAEETERVELPHVAVLPSRRAYPRLARSFAVPAPEGLPRRYHLIDSALDPRP